MPLQKENRLLKKKTVPAQDRLAIDTACLSKLLTRDREALPAAYLKDDRLRAAYLAYYLPANRAKIHTPLQELSLHPARPLAKQSLRILDLGSGPGTAVLGVLDFFSRQERRPVLAFTAVDPVEENLREAEALFQANGENVRSYASLKTIRSSIERAGEHLQGPFEVLILSNVLNELFPREEDRIAKRMRAVQKLMDRFLVKDGSCIILEPALRLTSRELLSIRDSLLPQGFSVYSPCLSNIPCPALADSKDWCHEDLPWDPPAAVKELDRLTGLRKDSLKFSYLVLRKDRLSLSDVYGARAFRVVSEPLVSKGKTEFYFCGAGGRRLVVRLSKDKSSVNASFDGLGRGDIVCLEKPIDEGKRLKVGKDTGVVIKGPRVAPFPLGTRMNAKGP